LSVSTEECSKKAIHDVFGSDSSNCEPNRKHYPDMHLVGSWNDALDISNVVGDDNLNLRVAHDIEFLRQYACKGDVANTRPLVYTDEEEREDVIKYLKNRSTATEEPFTEVVSKTTKKNLKKGFRVHNTHSKGRLPD